MGDASISKAFGPVILNFLMVWSPFGYRIPESQSLGLRSYG
jgi:hypothetical protein